MKKYLADPHIPLVVKEFLMDSRKSRDNMVGITSSMVVFSLGARDLLLARLRTIHCPCTSTEMWEWHNQLTRVVLNLEHDIEEAARAGVAMMACEQSVNEIPTYQHMGPIPSSPEAEL